MLRQFIGRITTSIVLAGVAIGAGTAMAAAQSFTDWGWPQPYEKVSDKSVAWLKEKGWWPLGVGWQGPFSGQNTINVVMDKAGLLAKRGLEAKYQAFAAGPDVMKRSLPRACRSAMVETFRSRPCLIAACRCAPSRSLRPI